MVDARHVVELDRGRFITMSTEAHLVFEARRRGEDVDAIAAALSECCKRSYTRDDVESVLAVIAANVERAAAKKSRALRLLRFDLVAADRVNAIAQRLTCTFEPRVAAWICGATLAAVIASFATNGFHAVSIRTSIEAYALFFLTVVAHEFGHATACRLAGERAGPIGFTAFFMFPALYTDVSRAWLLQRRHRLAVDIGGVYFQLPFVAMFAVGAAVTHSSALFLAEALVLTGMLLNLNPVFRFDGYWFLADALEMPNLAREPLRIVTGLIRREAILAGRPRWHVVVVAAYGVFNLMAWTYAAVASTYFLSHRAGDVVTTLRLGGLHLGTDSALHVGTALVSSALLTYGLIMLTRSAAAAIRRSLGEARKA